MEKKRKKKKGGGRPERKQCKEALIFYWIGRKISTPSFTDSLFTLITLHLINFTVACWPEPCSYLAVLRDRCDLSFPILSAKQRTVYSASLKGTAQMPSTIFCTIKIPVQQLQHSYMGLTYCGKITVDCKEFTIQLPLSTDWFLCFYFPLLLPESKFSCFKILQSILQAFHGYQYFTSSFNLR